MNVGNYVAGFCKLHNIIEPSAIIPNEKQWIWFVKVWIKSFGSKAEIFDLFEYFCG